MAAEGSIWLWLGWTRAIFYGKGYTYLAPNYAAQPVMDANLNAPINDWGVGDTQDCCMAQNIRTFKNIKPDQLNCRRKLRRLHDHRFRVIPNIFLHVAVKYAIEFGGSWAHVKNACAYTEIF